MRHSVRTLILSHFGKTKGPASRASGSKRRAQRVQCRCIGEKRVACSCYRNEVIIIIEVSVELANLKASHFSHPHTVAAEDLLENGALGYGSGCFFLEFLKSR